MEVEIIETELKLQIFGFQEIAANKDYAGTAFRLMDKMWQVVRANGLKHKGLNIWVYEPNNKVFAGVELDDPSQTGTGLAQNSISLTKYGYYKHIGPYNLIGRAGDNMRAELKQKGFTPGFPYLEIYGHWTNDETKLETELLIALV